MASTTKLEQLIAPVITAHAAILVDLAVGGDRNGKIVEIFIDTETGVNAELCAEISREVAAIFEESADFSGPYNLVVSSPGIDRPLKFPVQYKRHLGRNLSVAYSVDNAPQTIKGELVDVQTDFISIHPADADDPVKIPFSGIREALVIPRW